MHYKKVPDDFSILTFGYEMFFNENGINICSVFEELHRVYHLSFKSLKEKIVKELDEDNATQWYSTRTSDIFLTPRERQIMPKRNGYWISHYFKMNAFKRKIQYT